MWHHRRERRRVLRPIPELHDLRAGGGDAAAGPLVRHVQVFRIGTLVPRGRHEFPDAHVRVVYLAVARTQSADALGTTRRLERAPQASVGRARCPQRAAAASRRKPLAAPRRVGRAQLGHHCRHVNGQHCEKRIPLHVVDPGAVLGVGDDGVELRVAGGDDEAAALQLHDVVLSLPVLALIFPHARRLGGEILADGGLQVYPPRNGGLCLVAGHLRRVRGGGCGD